MTWPRGRRGGRDAEIQRVYREHVGAVYAFLSYSVGADVAEDLTAATFERVVRSWDRFDPSRSTPRTWVLAIARNILTDHFRRQGFRSHSSLDETPALADHLVALDDPAVRLADAEAFTGWLRALTPRERHVLALRYGADLSTPEIAETLALSETNVQQIAARALRRLRAAVDAGGVSDSASPDARPAPSGSSA